MIWFSLVGLVTFALMFRSGAQLGVGCVLPMVPKLRGHDPFNVFLTPLPLVLLSYAGLTIVLVGLMLATGAGGAVWQSVLGPLCGVTCSLSLREIVVRRSKSGRYARAFWAAGLMLSSLVAAGAQGGALGALLMMFAWGGESDPSGTSPVVLLAAATAVLGHGFAGTVWIWSHTSGTLERRMLHFATGLGLATLAMAALLVLDIPSELVP